MSTSNVLDSFQLGVWEVTLTGAAGKRFGPISTIVEGVRTHGEFEHDLIEAVERQIGVPYDSMPEELLPFEYEVSRTTNEYLTNNGTQAFFVTVFDYGKAYGGPEEGGWWFEVGTPIKFYACSSADSAWILREILTAPHLLGRNPSVPDAGKYAPTGSASSVLGGEDYSVSVDVRPGVAFPETTPRYE